MATILNIFSPIALRAPGTLPSIARSASSASLASAFSDFDIKSAWNSPAYIFPFGYGYKKSSFGDARSHSRGISFGSGFSSSVASSRSSSPALSDVSVTSHTHASHVESMKSFKFGGVTKSTSKDTSNGNDMWAHLGGIDTEDPTDDALFESMNNKATQVKDTDKTHADGPRIHRLGLTRGLPTPDYLELPARYRARPTPAPAREIKNVWGAPTFGFGIQQWSPAPTLAPLYTRVNAQEPKTAEDFGAYKDFKLEDPAETYHVPAFHLAAEYTSVEEEVNTTGRVFTSELCPDEDEVYLPRPTTNTSLYVIGAKLQGRTISLLR